METVEIVSTYKNTLQVYKDFEPGSYTVLGIARDNVGKPSLNKK